MRINKRRLSFGAQDLFEQLGDDTTIKLMKEYGGRYITVPSGYSQNRAYSLLRILEGDELKRLVTYYGGIHLLIPKYDKIAKQTRNRRIKILRMENALYWSIPELAKKFHLTERQIYTILGEEPEEGLNLDLFPRDEIF